MSTNSKIEWCTATWNPVLGCDKVSPGCDRCYAITQARIRAANPNPKVAGAFAGLTERTDAGVDWTGRVNLLPERLDQPRRWRKPKLIFVNSLADLFHDAVPDEFIARVFAVMAMTPRHTYQVLTKRHARMRALLSSDMFRRRMYDALIALDYAWINENRVAWPLPNVWLGVSVEDQKWADIRIPALIETPAAVRFLSCEPLLGPVSLDRYLWLTGASTAGPFRDYAGRRRGGGGIGGQMLTAVPAGDLHWIIVGGESGPGARPMHPAWPRMIRDQCADAGVPFHFKQHGAWAPVEPDVTENRRESDWTVQIDGYHYPITEPHETPGDNSQDATVRLVGKHAAGRVLDGRTWDEHPETSAA